MVQFDPARNFIEFHGSCGILCYSALYLKILLVLPWGGHWHEICYDFFPSSGRTVLHCRTHIVGSQPTTLIYFAHFRRFAWE